jgi:hypothetical protein
VTVPTVGWAHGYATGSVLLRVSLIVDHHGTEWHPRRDDVAVIRMHSLHPGNMFTAPTGWTTVADDDTGAVFWWVVKPSERDGWEWVGNRVEVPAARVGRLPVSRRPADQGTRSAITFHGQQLVAGGEQAQGSAAGDHAGPMSSTRMNARSSLACSTWTELAPTRSSDSL